MNREQLITYPTARLAKEIGFPQTNTKQYDVYTEDGFLYNCLDVPFHKLELKTFYAPTQGHLQRHLREEHNCLIVITPEIYDDGINWNWQLFFYKTEPIFTYDNDRSTMMYGDNGEHDTYEDALEVALQKAMNIIVNK
jgi:hypothetical protein